MVNISEVMLLPPVNPGQIISIGLNFALHAKESGKSISGTNVLMIFMVSPNLVVADGEEISLPNLENRIDYET